MPEMVRLSPATAAAAADALMAATGGAAPRSETLLAAAARPLGAAEAEKEGDDAAAAEDAAREGEAEALSANAMGAGGWVRRRGGRKGSTAVCAQGVGRRVGLARTGSDVVVLIGCQCGLVIGRASLVGEARRMRRPGAGGWARDVSEPFLTGTCGVDGVLSQCCCSYRIL